MAAAIQNQIRIFEGKFKPYLYEGPFTSYWGLLEQKTKFKREQVALGLVGFLAIYLVLGWGNDFVSNFIGFLYPAYASVLAVESKVTLDDTQWLVYWIVYALFGFIEYVGYTFFHALPFYWLVKCLFLIWLMAPGSKGGSTVLYSRVIRPLVLKYHPAVNQHTQEGKAYIYK